MTWKKKYKDRREGIPNKTSKKPTISFHSNLSADVLIFLKNMKRLKKGSEFLSQAAQMRYFYLKNKKRFIEEIVREHFQLTKRLLRREGSRRNAVTKE